MQCVHFQNFHPLSVWVLQLLCVEVINCMVLNRRSGWTSQLHVEDVIETNEGSIDHLYYWYSVLYMYSCVNIINS